MATTHSHTDDVCTNHVGTESAFAGSVLTISDRARPVSAHALVRTVLGAEKVEEEVRLPETVAPVREVEGSSTPREGRRTHDDDIVLIPPETLLDFATIVRSIIAVRCFAIARNPLTRFSMTRLWLLSTPTRRFFFRNNISGNVVQKKKGGCLPNWMRKVSHFSGQRGAGRRAIGRSVAEQSGEGGRGHHGVVGLGPPGAPRGAPKDGEPSEETNSRTRMILTFASASPQGGTLLTRCCKNGGRRPCP